MLAPLGRRFGGPNRPLIDRNGVPEHVEVNAQPHRTGPINQHLRIGPTTSTRIGTPSIVSGKPASGAGAASRLTFTPYRRRSG